METYLDMRGKVRFSPGLFACWMIPPNAPKVNILDSETPLIRDVWIRGVLLN